MLKRIVQASQAKSSDCAQNSCGLHAWGKIISGFPGGESERVRYKSTDWIASVKKDVEC